MGSGMIAFLSPDSLQKGKTHKQSIGTMEAAKDEDIGWFLTFLKQPRLCFFYNKEMLQ
jgi:hypothetical protein